MSIKHAILAAAVVLGGSVANPRTQTAVAETQRSAECPDYVRGAKLAVRDVSGGVELKITTPWTVRLAPLRQLLRQLAVVVEDYSHKSDEARTDQLELPPLAVKIHDVTSGSLIVVQAENATHVPILREQAKLLSEFWFTSECINGKEGRIASR